MDISAASTSSRPNEKLLTCQTKPVIPGFWARCVTLLSDTSSWRRDSWVRAFRAERVFVKMNYVLDEMPRWILRRCSISFGHFKVIKIRSRSRLMCSWKRQIRFSDCPLCEVHLFIVFGLNLNHLGPIGSRTTMSWIHWASNECKKNTLHFAICGVILCMV